MEKESLITALEGVKFRKAIIDKTKAELNQKLAESFSVFSYIPFDEVSMSSLFKDLLDINGDHGQGKIFLSEFIHLVEKKIGIEVKSKLEEELFEIKTEVRTSRIDRNLRRIDILLSWGQSFAIAIENKPYDKDQPLQLNDYIDQLEKEFHGNYILVYLSDREPSEISISKERLETLTLSKRYLRINFINDILDWLKASKREVRSLKIQMFLEDLIKKIMEREGITKEVNKEIVDYILLTNENLNAAFEMVNSLDSVLNEIALQWVDNFKSELENQTGRTFNFNNLTVGKRINLSIHDEKWKENSCGLFDVGDNSGLFYSVIVNSELLNTIQTNNQLSDFTYWKDKEGKNHKYRVHSLNRWHAEFSSVIKFKKDMSATITEIRKLIDFLDNSTTTNN